jgi:hypothetical protein
VVICRSLPAVCPISCTHARGLLLFRLLVLLACLPLSLPFKVPDLVLCEVLEVLSKLQLKRFAAMERPPHP